MMDGSHTPNDGHHPQTTEVVLPGEDFVLDHWTVSAGSIVRAGDIVAYARRRGGGNESSERVNDEPSGGGSEAPTAAKTAHKRPTRRRRPQPAQHAPAAPTTATSQEDQLSAVSSANANKKLKDRITAKFAAKEPPVPVSIHLSSVDNQHDDRGPALSLSPEVTSTTIESNGKVAIRAVTGGIMRPDLLKPQQTSLDESKLALTIGCIEECLHPTFVFGLCAVCGMSEGDARKQILERSGGMDTSSTSQTNINSYMTGTSSNSLGGQLVTVSGGATLVVSEKESLAMAKAENKRLVALKKLSLVLDLDHTLIHATPDGRAAQFHMSSGNPDSHPDVRTIRLRCIAPPQPVAKSPATMVQQIPSTVKHYVKLRPHVTEFFKSIQSKYEVTVYTAGTREYAEQIVLILSRSIVGSHRDWDDLENLRLQLEKAQAEYDAMRWKLSPGIEGQDGGSHEDTTLTSSRAKMDDNDTDDTGAKQKRKVEMTFPDKEGTDHDACGTDEPIKKKRKVVSFGLPESTKGDGIRNQKSDHITKEKLEELQKEWKHACELEDKARELRKTLFGSRLVSRTDVGDLGSDVKSLRRIFPCGGTMAVAVDDREDVWANAKDNTSSTVKGEPPANLLHVRPYHWERFQGMKDINNASGQDPSSSCAGNDHSDPNKESDPSLLWIEDILDRLYDRFYGQSMVETDAKTVPVILKQMRQEVFATKRLVLSGLIPRHGIELFKEGGPRPTIVRWAQDLGAEIQETVEYGVTHVVTGREHTGSQKSLDALKTPGCVLVQDNWLFDSYWSISPRDVRPYLIGVGKGDIPATPPTPSAEVLKRSYANLAMKKDGIDNNAHRNEDKKQNGGSDMMEIDEDADLNEDEDDDDDCLEDEFAAAFEEDFQCQ